MAGQSLHPAGWTRCTTGQLLLRCWPVFVPGGGVCVVAQVGDTVGLCIGGMVVGFPYVRKFFR